MRVQGEWTLERQLDAVAVLGENFYQVVPEDLKTFCSVASRIAVHAMRRAGVACELLPCQMWYAEPGRNIVVGFTGKQPAARGKWDGHVMCAGEGWFLDAAVHHLRAEFGVPVPRLIGGRRFTFRSQAIARFDLNSSARVWWHHPPTDLDSTPPQEPEALVSHYGNLLGDRLMAHLRESAAPLATHPFSPAPGLAA